MTSIHDKLSILEKENEMLSIMNLKYRNRILQLNTKIEALEKNLKENTLEESKNETKDGNGKDK